ncbi:MAG TPA: hypothetical protein VKV96_04100 [Roseiarcus sp.]|nr:hypothetical protein [Roseiarcus sp.]
MFQNMIDEAKGAIRAAARASGVIAAAALAGFATLCFLCAAGFVFLFQRYSLIVACLAGAALFFVIAILLLSWADAMRRRAARRRKPSAPSVVQTALSDPMVIATGLQVVRAIGVKRLIPLIALGGLALGLLAKAPKPPRRES